MKQKTKQLTQIFTDFIWNSNEKLETSLFDKLWKIWVFSVFFLVSFYFFLVFFLFFPQKHANLCHLWNENSPSHHKTNGKMERKDCYHTQSTLFTTQSFNKQHKFGFFFTFPGIFTHSFISPKNHHFSRTKLHTEKRSTKEENNKKKTDPTKLWREKKYIRRAIKSGQGFLVRCSLNE